MGQKGQHAGSWDPCKEASFRGREWCRAGGAGDTGGQIPRARGQVDGVWGFFSGQREPHRVSGPILSPSNLCWRKSTLAVGKGEGQDWGLGGQLGGCCGGLVTDEGGLDHRSRDGVQRTV